MKIFMACPAPAGSRKGNRVTADRWAGILKSLRHRVVIGSTYDGAPADLLVALHASKSYDAVVAFRRAQPNAPIIVVLTGTDLYRSIQIDRRAKRSLDLADRLVLLQPAGKSELPSHARHKAVVIYQSAVPYKGTRRRAGKHFEVCVLGHLRYEKDPFRTAMALRFVPAESKIRVTHLGQALTPALARQAGAWMKKEPRYVWKGEVSGEQARRVLAQSQLLVLSSRMEGGANVVSEAIAEGVPVLASRISGSIGLLGNWYPGFFPVEDAEALGRLLWRAESDPDFYAELKRWITELKPLVSPDREKASWRDLLSELVPKTVAR